MRERDGAQEESVYALGGSCGMPLSSNGAPRVARHRAPAASQKPKMHVDSSQVESCLNPLRGVRDAQRRAGIKPTDHARQNLLAVKERSRLNALRRLSQAEAGDACSLPDAATRQLRTAPAAGSRRVGVTAMGLPVTAGARSMQPQRGAGSSGAGSGSSSGGGGLARDFIEENKAAAAAAAARRAGRGGAAASLRQAPGSGVGAGAAGNTMAASVGAGADYMHKRDYGRVPSYLVERRLQMAEEQRAREAAREAALVPAGMRVMGEEERLETLELLARNRAEVEGALSALSLTSDTIGARRRRDELERRLAEVADAVKVFSRPRVMVRL